MSQFKNRVRNFVQKVVRTRIKLIEQRSNHLDIKMVNSHIAQLQKTLNDSRYNSDANMAKYWKHHKNRILELMPGRENTLFEELMDEYLQIDNDSLMHLR